jgi:hypothetical protein
MRPIERGAPELWPFVLHIIERAAECGLLKPSTAEVLNAKNDILV